MRAKETNLDGIKAPERSTSHTSEPFESTQSQRRRRKERRGTSREKRGRRGERKRGTSKEEEDMMEQAPGGEAIKHLTHTHTHTHTPCMSLMCRTRG